MSDEHERWSRFLSLPLGNVAEGVIHADWIGRRFGSYEVVALLGAGGMGEVYRGRDSRLGRDVAIKVLPASFLADRVRLARFEREARALAALNHHRIAAIYDVEDVNGTTALILEFVDGETLADRVERGPIPFRDALRIAAQAAEALEAAHEKGIIHRDLKPSNIALPSTGGLKVLDFGLAKAAFATTADVSQAPTLTVTEQSAGEVMGTPAYMSPEQVTGKPVDGRSDIWALGCVLYEMLTGRAAFARDTITETLARIIEREPAWEALPANTPSSVTWILRRCLEKDPSRRLHAAADVRIAIEDALVTRKDGEPAAASISRREVTRSAILVACTAMAFAGLLLWRTTYRDTRSGVTSLRLDLNTAPTNDPTSFALSPDGRQLVFVALEQQIPQLWLRLLDQVEPQRLPETEGASYPFWAPNSRSIGFFADGLLKRIDLAGGKPRALAHARNPMGGAWSSDDVILFSPSAAYPLMRVPANGGPSTEVTHLSKGEVSHRFPTFFSGHRFLFRVSSSAPEIDGVYAGSLDTSATHRILAADTAAEYTAAKQIMTVRDGVLMAVPFDPLTATVTGDAITVAGQLASDQGHGAFSVAGSGLVAYRVGHRISAARELVWIGRDGNTTGTVPAQGYPALTVDGRHVAVIQSTPLDSVSNTDLWIVDAAQAPPRRFTFAPGFDVNAVWSPDGARLAFASNRNGVFDIFEKPVNFARDERVLLSSRDSKFPVDWSPDGESLLFTTFDEVGGDELWTLPFRDPEKPIKFLSGSSQGQFSPDGRWVAYRSNESGRWEIYVRPYPESGGQQLVSRGGGIQPRWRRDGAELFYIGADRRLMAVPMRLPSQGGALEIGAAVSLFSTRLANPTNQQFGYAAAPDGQRFLMSIVADQTTTTPITVVQNWMGNVFKPEAR